jgi:hypothetical protein
MRRRDEWHLDYVSLASWSIGPLAWILIIWWLR